MHLRLLIIFFATSLLLSVPSIIRIPRFFPFIRSEVRTVLPQAQKELEEKGLWLVNIDLQEIEERNQEICFRWVHRYTSAKGTSEPEHILTCSKR